MIEIEGNCFYCKHCDSEMYEIPCCMCGQSYWEAKEDEDEIRL